MDEVTEKHFGFMSGRGTIGVYMCHICSKTVVRARSKHTLPTTVNRPQSEHSYHTTNSSLSPTIQPEEHLYSCIQDLSALSIQYDTVVEMIKISSRETSLADVVGPTTYTLCLTDDSMQGALQ